MIFIRSCKEAGIVPHWCTCEGYKKLDHRSKIAVDGSKYVVRQLNGLLVKYKASVHKGYVCANLTLSKTVSARSRVNRQTGRHEYLLIVETTPGRSIFEVTIDQEENGGSSFGMFGDVSRINMYGFQSKCTNDWKLKKHCYCVKKK